VFHIIFNGGIWDVLAGKQIEDILTTALPRKKNSLGIVMYDKMKVLSDKLYIQWVIYPYMDL
jgi:hypothetical protein